MGNDDKGTRPSAVIGKDGLVVVPQLAPEYSLSGQQAISGGLMGMAERAIAMQAGSFDMEMAKTNIVKLEAFKEFLKKQAFSKLRESDFVKFSTVSDDEDDDGKPWLSVGAAERVAETCGIDCGFLEPAMETETGEDAQGPWFIRRARMYFRFGAHYQEAIGEIDSRDSLLSHQGKLTASQVPRTKIGQKAISRATQIGIGKILGLRSLTWERIDELMGEGVIDPKKVKGAKFKKGRQGGGLEKGKDDDNATSSQFAAVYRAWGKATGRNTGDNDFQTNMPIFGKFINGVLEDPPDTHMRKWSAYKMGEVRAMMKATEDLAAQGGSHE